MCFDGFGRDLQKGQYKEDQVSAPKKAGQGWPPLRLLDFMPLEKSPRTGY